MKPLETILLLLRLAHHEARFLKALICQSDHLTRHDFRQANACKQAASHWQRRTARDLITWSSLTWPLSTEH